MPKPQGTLKGGVAVVVAEPWACLVVKEWRSVDAQLLMVRIGGPGCTDLVVLAFADVYKTWFGALGAQGCHHCGHVPIDCYLLVREILMVNSTCCEDWRPCLASERSLPWPS